DLFLWPTLYLWEFPKPTISQIHGYCMGGGIYLGLLTDFCVASEDAYFQMPLAQSLGEPGGHTMIEPWLMMNWHRTMDWLLLAPTLSAQEALDWGLLNKVVPRENLEETVEEMARKIGQIPLTTLMAVKNNVKRAWELMGMRVHLQVSHILTNMVGAASDVQARRSELMQSGMKPREFVDVAEHHRVGDASASTQILSPHHRRGDVARRIQTADRAVVLVEHPCVLVGDHSSAGTDIGGNDFRRVVRCPVERPERGVRAIPRITEAGVVRRLAAPEIRVEAPGGKLVEALDRLLQGVGRHLHLAGQLDDGVAPQDGAPLDQVLGQTTFLERVRSRH